MYSFADLLSEVNQTAEWDGVRNYQARNFLRDQIQIGDGVLFYHSNTKPMGVVGTAVVVRDGYPDNTAWDPRSDHPDPRSTPSNPTWYMVDIQAEQAFPNPVILSHIKATPELAVMVLVTNSRLSVQPVTEQEWKIIIRLGNTNAT